MSRTTALLVFGSLLPLSGCFQLAVSADAGYTSMALNGNIGLAATSGSLGVSGQQDFDSGFGLGDASGSPYARAELDLGVPVVSVSGFRYSESGTGTLTGDFGDITVGTQVDSKLEFTNIKAAVTFDIPLGPVKLSPGIAVDYFDLDMTVDDTLGFVQEHINLQAPVPLAYLRAEGDLGIVAAVAEVGAVRIPRMQDIEGTLWDAEARVEVRPTPLFHLFAGYRIIHVEGNGTVDNQDFDTSFDIGGWMIGGGVRF